MIEVNILIFLAMISLLTPFLLWSYFNLSKTKEVFGMRKNIFVSWSILIGLILFTIFCISIVLITIFIL